MLVACWSIKGGSGTTVVAAALAVMLARRSPEGAVLADLAGDGAAVLGLPEPGPPGLAGWLSSGDDVPADALARLEVPAGRGLTLLPRGPGPLAAGRVDVLAGVLDGGSRPVVADCGVLPAPGDTEHHVPSAAIAVDTIGPRSAAACPPERGDAALALVAAARRSILVTRPCYLALRRAHEPPLHPTGVVVVHEPGRALGRADVERIVSAPVVAEVAVDPVVARAVDAGLLAGRLPRSIERSLRHAA